MMQGKVTTLLLNVRSQPDVGAAKLGELTQDQVVDVISRQGEWFEIRFAGQAAFVHGDFVEIIQPAGEGEPAPEPIEPVEETPTPGPEEGEGLIDAVRRGGQIEIVDLPLAQVDTSILNVRSQPSISADKVGELFQGQIVEVVAEHGEWLEIEFDDQPAFIHRDFVVTGDQVVPHYLYQRAELRAIPLEPTNQLPVSGSGQQQLIARTWNQYGSLLQALADVIGVDVGVAIAVLCVESGGRGFADDGRMIIRFENHLFWNFWGQNNAGVFQNHFRFDHQAKWRGHEFRASPGEPWQSFHGNQDKEWQVLEFARGLDDVAALESISMGAPQVMGFNCAKIGYPVVKKMFARFQSDIRYHIFGLFDFFDAGMIDSLKQNDFVAFASRYNGPGQAQMYGGLIKDHFELFKAM